MVSARTGPCAFQAPDLERIPAVPRLHRQVSVVGAESADGLSQVRATRELEQRTVIAETAHDDGAVVALDRVVLEARVHGEAEFVGIVDGDFLRDPQVGQSHGGDGLVPKPEAIRLGHPGGSGQLYGPADRVECLEPLAHTPAMPAGFGLVRVRVDQVAVGLVALGLELVGEPAIAVGRHRRDDRDPDHQAQAAELASASGGLRLHQRQ